MKYFPRSDLKVKPKMAFQTCPQRYMVKGEIDNRPDITASAPGMNPDSEKLYLLSFTCMGHQVLSMALIALYISYWHNTESCLP